jgi:hypothetical protein
VDGTLGDVWLIELFELFEHNPQFHPGHLPAEPRPP